MLLKTKFNLFVGQCVDFCVSCYTGCLNKIHWMCYKARTVSTVENHINGINAAWNKFSTVIVDFPDKDKWTNCFWTSFFSLDFVNETYFFLLNRSVWKLICTKLLTLADLRLICCRGHLSCIKCLLGVYFSVERSMWV